MRTRKRQKEIITRLQEQPFTQDFRCAAGLATCSAFCDPKKASEKYAAYSFIKKKKLLLLKAGYKCCPIVVLLEISAVFNTNHHNVWPQRLRRIKGIAPHWFESESLYHKLQLVHVNWEFIHIQMSLSPTGLCAGISCIYIIYTSLSNVINKHWIFFHCYADDNQL